MKDTWHCGHVNTRKNAEASDSTLARLAGSRDQGPLSLGNCKSSVGVLCLLQQVHLRYSQLYLPVNFPLQACLPLDLCKAGIHDRESRQVSSKRVVAILEAISSHFVSGLESVSLITRKGAVDTSEQPRVAGRGKEA